MHICLRLMWTSPAVLTCIPQHSISSGGFLFHSSLCEQVDGSIPVLAVGQSRWLTCTQGNKPANLSHYCAEFFLLLLFFLFCFFQVQHCLFNKRDIKHPRMNFRDWTVKTCILESLTGCYIFRVFFTNLIKTCVGINPVSWIISVKMRCGYLSAQVIFSQYIWTELTQWTLFILSSVSSVLVLQQWHQEVFLFYIHSCRSLQIWF